MRDKKRRATHVGIPEEASSDAGSIPAASTIANNSNLCPRPGRGGDLLAGQELGDRHGHPHRKGLIIPSLPFSYAQRQPGRTSLPKDAGRATTQPDRLSKPDKLPRLRAAQRFEAQYVDSARNGVLGRAPGEPVRTRR